jgi:hypothetical protein
MHATIKTPGEHFGHLDGAAAAEVGTERYPDRAFERRRSSARLDELDRADYARSYTEAFDVACDLKRAQRNRQPGGLTCIAS